MPISIKNTSTENLARELATLTGASLTDTIHDALEDRLNRLKRERRGRTMVQEIEEIAMRCSQRPVISNLTADEILGYDELVRPRHPTQRKR